MLSCLRCCDDLYCRNDAHKACHTRGKLTPNSTEYFLRLLDKLDMQNEEIKKKMMKLWKDIFHDTDAYISLVFNNYFNSELIEYYEENGRIISALLGVPYEFGCGENKLRGLYLCGLATDEEFRNKGIMNSLIEKINHRAQEKGYSFTFLIPSSDALINYYSVKGYVNAMYRVEDCYTQVHNFEKDYMSILCREDDRVRRLKEKYYHSLTAEIFDDQKSEIRDEIISYIKNAEDSVSTYLCLRHSEKDIDTVINENIISGGKIIVSHSTDGKLTGVAFISIDYRKRVVISKVYYDDNCSLYKILDFVKNTYPDSPISVFCYPEETDRRVLWTKVYGAANPDGGNLEGAYGISERVYDVSRHARPYGMIRILDVHEILKFLANYRNDVKFSILVKEGVEGEKALKCVVNEGKINCETIDTEKIDRSTTRKADGMSVTTLKKKELMELLFRKKDSSNLIMEAFGIPRLPVNMCLLLD